MSSRRWVNLPAWLLGTSRMGRGEGKIIVEKLANLPFLLLGISRKNGEDKII